MKTLRPAWLLPGLTEPVLHYWLETNNISVGEDPLRIGLHAAYDWKHNHILLSPKLPQAHRFATLTHEAVHIYNEHYENQPLSVERFIDQAVAHALIDFDEYRFWEAELGGHAGGIAKALEQPLWLVEAFQRTQR